MFPTTHLEPSLTPGSKNARNVPWVENPWGLTPMEAACIGGITEGKTMKEIADDLCLSYKTVQTYVSRAGEKMEVNCEVPTVPRRAVMWALMLHERGAA